MPTSTTVNDLKINKLTEAQYDAAVQSGIIGENELSIITDLDEAIQVSSLPTAGASELGKIYQYIGATDSTYTNAYFYKCVSDGQSPATYSWEAVEVQEAGDSLPDQTGNAGKFLTTDGTDASWSNHFSTDVYMDAKKRFYFNKSTYVYTGFVLDNDYIGDDTSLRLICSLGDSRGIVFNAGTNYDAVAKIYSKGDPNYFDSSLGTTTRPWRRVYTWKLSNGEDISVPKVGGKLALQTNVMPTAASTNKGVIYQFTGTTDSTYTNGYFYKCVSDGQSEPTYSWEQVDVQPAADPLPSQTGNAGKVLTTDGTTASWTDLVSMPATMPELTVNGWSSNTQTVNVSTVTTDNVVFVSPAPLSATEYAECGVVCTAQAAGTLTFTCTTVPEHALTINVVCL